MKELNIFYKAPFGKLYKTRSGKKAIFVGRKSKYLYYLIVEGSPKYLTYFEYGRRFEDNDSNELSDYDIVGEWDSTINLEKEIDECLKQHNMLALGKKDFTNIAKYFFELGLRYKSSYVSIPNIDDTLKEMGVDPDSNEARNFKESYYRALDKIKEQPKNI